MKIEKKKMNNNEKLLYFYLGMLTGIAGTWTFALFFYIIK
jgi:hypothetical protein